MISMIDYRQQEVARLKEKVAHLGRKPCMAIIMADGFSEASERYVRNKHKLADEIGIQVIERRVGEKEYTNEWLEEFIGALNESDCIDGIIVQLPFFDVDENYISSLIAPEKDIDGFNPVNLGKLMRGEDCLAPCTPSGIVSWLEFNEIDLKGKDVCIVGRSNIVGKPLANMMINKGATVQVCNSGTEFLRDKTYNADIVVTAIGVPKFFDDWDFNGDAIVIDVGINFDENGKMCGDVDYDDAVDWVEYVTPVPRGVGTVTVLTLMKNTIKAYEMRGGK